MLTTPLPDRRNRSAPIWVVKPLLSLGSSDAVSTLAFDSSGYFLVAGGEL